MCGIVGSVGLENPKDFIVDGLKKLEYRGYDSAGVAYLSETIKIIKDKGTIYHLCDLLPSTLVSNMAIGHTRWATHGAPNKTNSHPHISFHKKIVLVHNGIIENFLDIKSFLNKHGYDFYSSTDTEVIVNLIEFFYLQNSDMLLALQKSMRILKGSYALCVINEDDHDSLYVMKNSSPLLIGSCQNYTLVSSDAGAMTEYTNKFIELEDLEYGKLQKDHFEIYNINGKRIDKIATKKDLEELEINLNGYPHYMLKEIDEIETVIHKIIAHYYVNEEFNFDKDLLEDMKQADSIIFIACGTSYHASLVGGRYFEIYNKSSSIYYASEWAFHPTFPGNKPFVILISQSGETADVIHCQKIINEQKIPHLVITNTDGSTLKRNATYSILLYAGKEISVASTKAYVAQVTLLAILSHALGNIKQVIIDLYKCLEIIRDIRFNWQDKIKDIANKIKDYKDIFYLGRGYDYFMALEASLKLKEISYIHSEAFAGGEIKHGPIALIEQNTPVIIFITDPEITHSIRSNIEEVKARGATAFTIAKSSLSNNDDNIVINEYPSYLSSVAISSFAFYLAYYVSFLKGYNVDKPRNLAKSVTVE